MVWLCLGTALTTCLQQTVKKEVQQLVDDSSSDENSEEEKSESAGKKLVDYLCCSPKEITYNCALNEVFAIYNIICSGSFYPNVAVPPPDFGV